MLLRYLVIQACASNEKIEAIRAVLPFVQPFPLGNDECSPAGSRFYTPAITDGWSSKPGRLTRRLSGSGNAAPAARGDAWGWRYGGAATGRASTARSRCS